MKKKNETEIDNLKKKLICLHKDYHLKIYKVLSKIYEKRKKNNPKYNYTELSKESVIKDLYEYNYISTIMNIGKISKRTMTLVNKGKFTLFEIANGLRKSKKLQKAAFQYKFYSDKSKQIEAGDLTKAQLRIDISKDYGQKKKNMNKESIWLLQTVYQIRTSARYIKQRFNRLSLINQTKIRKEIVEIYKFISDRKNKKYSLVSIKKESLKKLRKFKLVGVRGKTDSAKLERLIEHYITNDKAICKNCKKPFKKRRKTQIYCESECKRKYNYNKSKKKK
jgi:hypothetical protein